MIHSEPENSIRSIQIAGHGRGSEQGRTCPRHEDGGDGGADREDHAALQRRRRPRGTRRGQRAAGGSAWLVVAFAVAWALAFRLWSCASPQYFLLLHRPFSAPLSAGDRAAPEEEVAPAASDARSRPSEERPQGRGGAECGAAGAEYVGGRDDTESRRNGGARASRGRVPHRRKRKSEGKGRGVG